MYPRKQLMKREITSNTAAFLQNIQEMHEGIIYYDQVIGERHNEIKAQFCPTEMTSKIQMFIYYYQLVEV